MNKTSIEWTHRPQTGGAAGGFTWNPIRAKQVRVHADKELKPGTFCTRISPGCLHCYAAKINQRWGTGADYTVPNLANHAFYVGQRLLESPLRKARPCTIFGGDMYDLFHESIPDELIDRVVTVVALAPWHTFQFLTKRADRMARYFEALTWERILECANQNWEGGDHGVGAYNLVSVAALGKKKRLAFYGDWSSFSRLAKPPLPNLWLGVSVEDQLRADERIPLLLRTPAAVRFLSVEPQLERILLGHDTPEVGWISYLHGFDGCDPVIPKIDWVICGGESGPGARPFDLAWAESLRDKCKTAGVSFFMKQLGSNPQVHSCRNEKCTHADCGMEKVKLKDRKGGDPSEWPVALRVREFPA